MDLSTFTSFMLEPFWPTALNLNIGKAAKNLKTEPAPYNFKFYSDWPQAKPEAQAHWKL